MARRLTESEKEEVIDYMRNMRAPEGASYVDAGDRMLMDQSIYRTLPSIEENFERLPIAFQDRVIRGGRSRDEQKFMDLISIGVAIENWSNGDFEFKDGFLYFEGEQVDNEPTSRIIDCISQNFPHEFMLNYLSNLYDNVSNRAVQESYKWCSHKGIPITEDGMLIGYKGVAVYSGVGTKDKMNMSLIDGDLVDKYTGKS